MINPSANETRRPDTLISVAAVKRLLERRSADPDFADLLERDPAQAGIDCGFHWNPAVVRLLWDRETDLPRPKLAEAPEPVVAYHRFIQQKLQHRTEVRGCEPANERYRVWRRRQMARLSMEIGKNREETIIHAPVSFELTRGCSVGCWFCGISAPRMSDNFEYTPENAARWRDVLHTMGAIIGESARWGFCYWATDPMDNPNYENFCLDFYNELGVFPQTTTALALKNPERTRALLRLSEEKGTAVNRFSVLSLQQLQRIHSLFSAEELLKVECIPQNNEGPLPKARAGDAEARLGQSSKKSGRQLVNDQPGTIACVSGFLFNMVDRVVKLITPCASSAKWPLGYWILEEGAFQNADDLGQLINGMIGRHMYESVRELPRVRFADTVKYEPVEDGVEVCSRYQRVKFSGGISVAQLHRLGDSVAEASHSADDIALMAEYRDRVPSEMTIEILERFFRGGLLDEEPAPAAQRNGGITLYKEGDNNGRARATTNDQRTSLSSASQIYHRQWMQEHDGMLWFSRLQPPSAPGQLRRVLNSFGIEPKGILHVGAHFGLELEAYLASGIERMLFVEPNPAAFQLLQAHIEFWRRWCESFSASFGMANTPHMEAIQCALTDRPGLSPFYVSEMEMLSSILKPRDPQIAVQRVIEVKTETLDGLMRREGPNAAKFNLLNLDVQGAEKLVLEGGPKTLDQLDAILIELNLQQRYENAPLARELEAFLQNRGFERKSFQTQPGQDAYGDALFVASRVSAVSVS
jgi:radical SAM family RiPP maturation amino acid epimerase